MKKLAAIKRFVFVSVIMLVGVISWGQTLSPQYPAMDPETYGTEANPYVIGSKSDWNTFAGDVNDGYSYNGKYVKLIADITLTINNDPATDLMVGVATKSGNTAAEDKWFSGTFDGDWHTITFKVGNKNASYTPENTMSPSAPFRVIDGATINNLTVKDTIYAGNKYNSGIVGYAWKAKTNRSSYINNCTSSIIINCSKIEPSSSNPDCSSAGFVAENKSGGIYFENCIFDGKIDKGTHDNAQKCAGFLSFNSGDNVSYSHCTMAGTINLTSETATFHRKTNASFSNAYFITNYMNSSGSINPQGVSALDEPSDLSRKYMVGETPKYVPGTVITGLDTTSFQYVSTPIVLTPAVSYYGKTLTRGTDYVIKIGGDVLESGDPTFSAGGEYELSIEGKTGSNYAGAHTVTIKIIELNSWTALKKALSSDSGVFTLYSNIIADTTKEADTTLWVTGNITLNLNGNTINRGLTRIVSGLVEGAPDKNGPGQVIRIKNGASLTINGPGTITGGFHKGAEGNIDGGGIYNMGNLTLNNVNVIGNKCIKQDGENFSGRGGGIYSGNTASLIITGGEITDNEAIGGGGGIYCYMSNPFNMTGVNIKSNVSEDKGGGIRLVVNNGKTANIINCNIIGNCATVNTESKGGGIYYEGSSNTTSILNLVNDTLQANTSFILGGAIYSHKGTITATNCVMNNNLSFDDEGFWASDDSYGGAVCLYAGSSSSYSTFIMNGGSITGDLSKTNGGGIYVYTHSILQVMGNVIITDNTQMGNDMVSNSNNVYLAGAASGDVIQVIGELGPDAIIGIANSDPGTYIAVADTVSYEHILEHIALDNNENRMIIDENGEVQVYVPYSWNNTETWNGTIASDLSGSLPNNESQVTVNRAIKIPNNCVAEAAEIILDGSGEIIIEDGGQLITSNAVAVTAQKIIVAADAEAKSGWYLISSPVTNPNITSATNLITPVSDARYDLYRFNEAVELQWENYKAHSSTDFTTLENGRGYLYRNEHNHTVEIKGTLNVSDVTYGLSCSGSELTGFNIIGNPYSHNVYKGATGSAIPNGDLLESKYYMLNPTTSEWDLTDDGTVIPPLTGILVQATGPGTLTMTNSTAGEVVASKDAKDKNIWFTVANGKYEDKACVEFKEGHGLNKIEHFNEEAPMLYISHNDEDFASADINPDVKAFNLNFEAKTFGRYTLSVKPQGDYSYLHLYDKLTGKDVDLLLDNEYSFVGSTTDAADRFTIVLNPSTLAGSENEIFAYQSGNEIIVDGKGELQIFDVMGRMVAIHHVNGVQVIEKPSTTGVYIMRLNGMTQKIVIK